MTHKTGGLVAWDVYKGSRWIDRVYFEPTMQADRHGRHRDTLTYDYKVLV